MADPDSSSHIDFDGLRCHLRLGRRFLRICKTRTWTPKLQAIQGIFSFDPRTQLHGATVYSMSQTPPEGVLICLCGV